MARIPQSYRAAAKYVRARERAGECGRAQRIHCDECRSSSMCCLHRQWQQADRALSIANGKELT